jgi:hypothetical protein
LKADFGSTAISIYHCGAGEAQHVGPEASTRSHVCLCAGGLSAVAVEEANRTLSQATCLKLSRLATVSKTHSNALSGNAIEGILTNTTIRGNAFERHHTQRNRVPSRLAKTLGESKRRSSQARHSGCYAWKVKPI